MLSFLCTILYVGHFEKISSLEITNFVCFISLLFVHSVHLVERTWMCSLSQQEDLMEEDYILLNCLVLTDFLNLSFVSMKNKCILKDNKNKSMSLDLRLGLIYVYFQFGGSHKVLNSDWTIIATKKDLLLENIQLLRNTYKYIYFNRIHDHCDNSWYM